MRPRKRRGPLIGCVTAWSLAKARGSSRWKTWNTPAAAANTTEIAAGVLALQDVVLPRTLNYDEPEPECPIAVAREPQTLQRPTFVKVGVTDLGQCAAAVIRKWTE